MYAIFKNGGKQYKVVEGQKIKLEKLNVMLGKFIEFKKIIFFSNEDHIKIGNPFINEKKIIAEVINHFRGEKIKIIKFHRRKHSRKHQGHRQWFTEVKIISITD